MTINGNATHSPIDDRNDLRSYVTIRAVVVLLMLGQTLSGKCQSLASAAVVAAPIPSGWQRVEKIPLRTAIKLATRTASMNCALAAVDDDSLTCVHGNATTFARADVISIVVPHRRRSALILGGIGAGAGAATVKIIATAAFDGFFHGRAKGAVYAGAAGLGVVVFAPIGFGTDFTHSIVYQAH